MQRDPDWRLSIWPTGMVLTLKPGTVCEQGHHGQLGLLAWGAG